MAGQLPLAFLSAIPLARVTNQRAVCNFRTVTKAQHENDDATGPVRDDDKEHAKQVPKGRHAAQRRRRTSPVSQDAQDSYSAADDLDKPEYVRDLFRYFDDNEKDNGDDNDMNKRATSRPSNVRRSTEKGVGADASTHEHKGNEGVDGEHNDDALKASREFLGGTRRKRRSGPTAATEISDADYGIDDGFFSRYRRQASARKDPMEPFALDSEDPANAEDANANRLDRRKAASALDAVDRLFGAMNVSETSRSKGSSTSPSAAASTNEGSTSDNDIIEAEGNRWSDPEKLNREAWLKRIRARSAQRQTETSLPDGTDTDTTLDVQAVDARGSHTSDNSSSQRPLDDRVLDDDFDEADTDPTTVSEDWERKGEREFRAYRASSGRRETMSSKPGQNASRRPFARLLDVARRGGLSPGSQDVGHSAVAPGDPGVSANARSAKGRSSGVKTPHAASRGHDRSKQRPASAVDLLGLRRKNAYDVDDDVSGMDEMGAEEEGEGEGEDERTPTGWARDRKQKFIATRRVGGRERQILGRPVQWDPMTDEEIAGVRSESRPLIESGRAFGDVHVSDCKDCFGSGLEPCRICVGAGWVDPPPTTEEERRRLHYDVSLVWDRPNLVIDTAGAAQCPFCNGLGKQFCSTCEGSGSSLRKGFNVDERYQIFDMFQGSDMVNGDEEIYGEDIYGEEDLEDSVDEQEEYSIYTGSPDDYSIVGEKLRGSSVLEREKLAEEIDVIEEPSDLMPSLDDLALADSDSLRRPPRGRPGAASVIHSTNLREGLADDLGTTDDIEADDFDDSDDMDDLVSEDDVATVPLSHDEHPVGENINGIADDNDVDVVVGDDDEIVIGEGIMDDDDDDADEDVDDEDDTDDDILFS